MEKFVKMWEMMKSNSFEIPNGIDPDCLCTICKGLLIEATNAPCGCRYCKRCINEYLQTSPRKCPGTSEYCSEDNINIEKDIHIDQPINIKISRLVIKCPNKSCKITTEIRSMENHLLMCDQRSLNCPFIDIGCDQNRLVLDVLDSHLMNDILFHSKLLMKRIKNDQDETKFLSESLDKLRSDNNELTENLQHVNNSIRELSIRYDDDNIEKRISMVENDNKLLRAELEQLRKEYKQKALTNQLNQSYKNHAFIWNIDNWLEKQNMTKNGTDHFIYSDPFFSHTNGYKMRLQIAPNGFQDGKGTHLWVGFFILKGPFDNCLPWPLKHAIKLTLVNQLSGLSHVSFTFQYESMRDFDYIFNQPINENNRTLGETQFIELEQISYNPGICLNNRVIIKCSVKPVNHI